MEAVIYGAKSTDDKRGSIARQLEQCRAMAERESWRVAGEYQDENKSGYYGNRGDGLKAALARAEELAPCVLLVHHSDRLARGDAKHAKHLAHYALWAIEFDVSIRSVEDDATFTDVSTAASQGQRNAEDSRIKSVRTAEGHLATVEAGGWRGGTAPEGYVVRRSVDERGDKACIVTKHPEEAGTFELLWAMAVEGRSAPAISLELDRRGCVTRAGRPFALRRVQAALNNAFYAGVMVWRPAGYYRRRGLPVPADAGQMFPGGWPRYLEPEDFWRLKAARERRATRGGGRPTAAEYLLAGIARCALCGAPAHAITSAKVRKDGTRRRTYVCGSRRDHHRDSEHWCPAKPIDAEAADRLVLDGIDALLTDTQALRDQLEAGRRVEREKAEAAVGRARADAEAADRAADRADAAYADALADDDEAAAIALKAAKIKRAEARRARALMDAALDALAGAEDEPGEDAIERLAGALAGRVADAGRDVKLLNATLAESFRFELREGPRVTARLVGPALFRAAVAEHLEGAEFPAFPEFLAVGS